MIERLLNIIRRHLTPAGGIRYNIGGHAYRQRPLVLVQIEQLTELLSGIEIPAGTTAVGIVTLIGTKIADALAIVLTPEGVSIEAKEMKQEAAWLRNHVDIEIAAKVVEDFLSCNPINSVFEKLTGILGKGSALLGAPAVGSLISSASSRPATSPSAGPSSTAAP